MNKLPTETLLNIFVNLHFCEKQECMLVCHQWADIIRSTVLLDTVHINNKYTFAKLRRYLDAQASKKAQIKNLVIHSPLNRQEALNYFQKYFPRIRSLYIRDYTFHRLNRRNINQDNNKQSDFMSWIAKIEVFEQYNCSNLSQCFLTLGKFSALKKLVIDMSNFTGTLNINVLANAPNITNFTLRRCIIWTRDLEVIHLNLLLLESLKLDSITLGTPRVDDNIVLEAVIPSELVTTLLITTFHKNANGDTRKILECLRYIRHKYTNLLQYRFIIDSTEIIKDPAERTFIESGILPTLPDLNRGLSLLEVNCCTLLPSLLMEMHSLGFNTHCLNISLHFSTSKFLHRKNLLADNYSFIQQLTLNINSSKWIFHIARNMASLKILHIKVMSNFKYDRFKRQSIIRLEEIFSLSLKSLDSLIIETFDVDCITLLDQSFSLTKLEIYSQQIYTSAYRFISSCLPHLRYLTLGYMLTANKNINLDALRLYRLDLHMVRDMYIRITTDNGSKNRYFCAKGQTNYKRVGKLPDETRFWDTLYQIAPETARLHDHEMIYFGFNSIQQLYINHMLAQ
ncbi:hypothetical protein K501DRAFT_270708 [Backusella circina FSU 941]|nr:hypothetical protein K501DRAFT_270708 [Backusella circina FSU 941]